MKEWKELTNKERLDNGLDSLIVSIFLMVVVALLAHFFISIKMVGAIIALTILSIWSFIQAENAKQDYKMAYEIKKSKLEV